MSSRSSRSGRSGDGDDAADAAIVPIEQLTREATFRRLAELARDRDAVPPGLVDDVTSLHRQVPGWRSVDDELAVLAYDSDAEPAQLAAVRAGAGAGSRRRLRFEAPDLALEVEVTPGRPRELVCQVLPPQPAVLEVRFAAGVLPELSDDLGTFHVRRVPPGVVSLRCRLAGGRANPAATSWWRI